MDNPAVHNLDDVRLRAENGQLVLEVAGQTVPVDVDIDGGLSLDEIEAFTDNSIDAKGSNLENLGSVTTEQVGSERHYAGAYDGTSSTDRLNNAISAASTGDVIYLESESYDSITVSKNLHIKGTGGYGGGDPSVLTGSGETWTFDGRVYLTNINTAAGTAITLNDNLSAITGCNLSTATDVTINDDQCRIIDCNGGDVTFSNNTSGGLVDACTNTAFTDNDGGNTQGDIA